MEFKFEGDIFHDKEKAIDWFESILWPNGPICPHCKSVNRAHRLNGKSTKYGTRKCKGCRKVFNASKGTIFENSPIPLNKWIMAWLLFDNGINPYKVSKFIGVTRKTAGYMSLRIKHGAGVLKKGELFKYKVQQALNNLASQGRIVRVGKYYHSATKLKKASDKQIRFKKRKRKLVKKSKKKNRKQ